MELKISNLLLNKETQIIKITKFKNNKEALNYYNATLKEAYWIELYNQKGIDKMVISKNNFIGLLKQKTTQEYKIYFKEKYLE